MWFRQTSAEDNRVRVWKEYFENILNATGTPSIVEAKSRHKGMTCLSNNMAGPLRWMGFTLNSLKALGVVGLSWLQHPVGDLE